MIRFLDIFFSSLALLLFSPIFFFVILILKFTGEGEIWYFQPRVGMHQNKFNLIKFVTMIKNSENMGTGTVTLKNDSRILPFGKFLRKTKINELPQLLNILKGDMSIIGPRPQDERCFKAFPSSKWKVICSVRPGLSGIGSIVFRNEEEMLADPDNSEKIYDHIIMPYKANLEEWFTQNNNLLNYLKLIVLTLLVVLLPKGDKYINIFFRNLPTPNEEMSRLQEMHNI
tara:strand:+ start:35867 stop:36550 length:684 start_codon:yes stop_codon:yes gene_type:complete